MSLFGRISVNFAGQSINTPLLSDGPANDYPGRRQMEAGTVETLGGGGPSVYTAADIAHLFKISVPAVHRLLNSGVLGGLRVGKRWRVTEEQVEAYLDRQVVA